MIGILGLEAAVAASKNIFAQLQAGHPGMKAFLVLAHHGRQTELTSDPIRILEDCEPMIASDDIKREALRLLSEKGQLESAGASEKAIQPVIKALAARGRELRFLPEVQVEIRFHVLKYALVWALQSDPLIDRELTPQTKASIRIVLGTVERLSRKDKAQEFKIA